MAGIYFHIPFCKRLCGYCDFFKSLRIGQLGEVVQAMEREVCQSTDFLRDKSIRTIYFGGGTPSLLNPRQIESLLSACRETFDTSPLEEITLEANPDDLSEEYLRAIYNIGINRLSIGIQSFDDNILRFMNRRHNAQQAVEAVERARSVGFDNITIDLIFGIEGYPTRHLERSIDTALELSVEHISAYHLTIESGTEFARRVRRGELSEASEERSEMEYMLLHRRLTENSFEHYEVSNYALKARRSKHNSSYWQGVEYLGIGAGAHSYNGDIRRVTLPSIENYLEGRAQRYEMEELTRKQRYNEYIMTSLRWAEGVDINMLKSEFGEKYHEYFCKRITKWINSSEVVNDQDRVYIRPEKYLLSDFIIESLLTV